jgi:prevent-host-death family protein
MSASFSIYETKAKLSELLRRVKAGQDLIVTERGRPIAKIVPYQAAETETLSERVERLKESGQIIGGGEGPVTIPVLGKKPGALKRFLKDR